MSAFWFFRAIIALFDGASFTLRARSDKQTLNPARGKECAGQIGDVGGEGPPQSFTSYRHSESPGWPFVEACAMRSVFSFKALGALLTLFTSLWQTGATTHLRFKSVSSQKLPLLIIPLEESSLRLCIT